MCFASFLRSPRRHGQISVVPLACLAIVASPLRSVKSLPSGWAQAQRSGAHDEIHGSGMMTTGTDMGRWPFELWLLSHDRPPR